MNIILLLMQSECKYLLKVVQVLIIENEHLHILSEIS
jgi:hypothetical protein